MNKFIVLALIAASVALASAAGISGRAGALDEEASELAISPDNSEEAEKLGGTNLEGFADFCYRTRDTVIGDMRRRGNIFASGVFASIFNSLGQVAQSGVNANTKATNKLSSQLTNPEAPVDESSTEEVDKIIAKGQKAIQEAQNQPQGFLAAFMTGIKSFAAAGYGEAVAKIVELQKELGAKAVSESLIGFCEQLSVYEKQAVEIFEDVKSGLVAENAEQYQNVRFQQVAPKCVTANRLTRADGFCKFVLAAKTPLSKVFGIELPSNNSEQ